MAPANPMNVVTFGSVAASASTAAPPAEWPTAPTRPVSMWPWNGLDVDAFWSPMSVRVASRSSTSVVLLVAPVAPPSTSVRSRL